MTAPSAPCVVMRTADALEHVIGRPAGLVLDHRGFVGVGHEQVGAVDQRPHLLAIERRQLLRRVRDERDAAVAALLGVPDHRVRVVGADDNEVDRPP